MTDIVEDSNPRDAIPTWFRLYGWFVFAGCALFALRLIYEETLLTWQNGPQMLLFSIAHVHGLFLAIGTLATLLTYVWIAIFAGMAIIAVRRRMRIAPSAWIQCAALTLFALSFYVPYETWQWLTLEIAGLGPQAATQMGYAAGGNKQYLARAFLSKGLAADSRGEDSKTALDIACKADRHDLAQYLVAGGANLDLAPDCRRFPEFASRMKPPVPPQTSPDTGLPKVPNTTIEVTAPDPRGSYPQSN